MYFKSSFFTTKYRAQSHVERGKGEREKCLFFHIDTDLGPFQTKSVQMTYLDDGMGDDKVVEDLGVADEALVLGGDHVKVDDSVSQALNPRC